MGTAIATSISIRLFSQKDKLTVHVLKSGGAVDVPRFEASSGEICPSEVGTNGKSFGEVSVLQVCALEGCAAEVYLFKVSSDLAPFSIRACQRGQNMEKRA